MAETATIFEKSVPQTLGAGIFPLMILEWLVKR